MSDKPLVFIDGLDGSGKSTLAKQLLAALKAQGQNGVLIAVDDFRRSVDWNTEGASEEEVYYNQYFDLEALDTVLAAVAQGAKQIVTPVFAEGRRSTSKSLDIPQGAVILVEGVFTQRLAAATSGALIYLHCDWQAARLRILRRDQERGRTAADVEHRIDRRYFPAQRRYQAQYAPDRKANWVVVSEPKGPSRPGFSLQRGPQPVDAPGLSGLQAMAVHAALQAL